MNDEAPRRLYEQTVVAITRDHAASVQRARYNPWRLGVYVTLALAAPIALGEVGLAVRGFLAAALLALLAIPVPVFVILWAIDAGLVEHARLRSEKLLLTVGPALPPAPTLADDADPEEVELRPGYPIDGVMTAPAEGARPEVVDLRDDCLAFVRAGMRRSGWSRSKIAEGSARLLSPSAWDRASRELQRLGFFRTGPAGLEPARDLGDVIARLEAAR
jgi:hypothetical protein